MPKLALFPHGVPKRVTRRHHAYPADEQQVYAAQPNGPPESAVAGCCLGVRTRSMSVGSPAAVRICTVRGAYGRLWPPGGQCRLHAAHALALVPWCVRTLGFSSAALERTIGCEVLDGAYRPATFLRTHTGLLPCHQTGVQRPTAVSTSYSRHWQPPVATWSTAVPLATCRITSTWGHFKLDLQPTTSGGNAVTPAPTYVPCGLGPNPKELGGK